MLYKYFRFLNNLLLWVPVTHFYKLRGCILRLGGVEIGCNVTICGGSIVLGRGRLVIGNDTWISPRVVIYTHVDAPVIIGRNCDIGPEVKFVTGTHEIGSVSRRAGVGIANSITVGDGCWIGASVTLLGGANIGDGVVIAAGSVVKGTIPSNVLIAGVPARVKRILESNE